MRLFGPSVVFAAGALVWREREGVLEVLAVHRPRYDDWSWPKGKLDEGETLPACAVREVAEETGMLIELGQPLPTLKYAIGAGRTKVVYYWAARALDPESPAAAARAKTKAASKHEIDDVSWIPATKARSLITFDDDLLPLERLMAEHRAGRLDSRAFIVARHARARRRKAWSGADRRRPLTKGGAARAQELVGLFSAFGAERIASSPALRCLQTVGPYAQAAGIPVRGHGKLTEEAHKLRPEVTAKTIEELLLKKKSRIVSVHRPTLPTIMAVLRAATSSVTRGLLPRTMPFLPAGGVLVAHVVTVRGKPLVAAVETHLLHPGRGSA